MEKVYVKPTMLRIGATKETAKLYDLEDRRDELIKGCAREWARLLGFTDEEFWTVAVPQQLFDLLEAFDHRAAKVAAEAYLEYLQHRFGPPQDPQEEV